MDLGLTGKAALVVGASRGIGFAIAQALAAEGARVAIASREPAALHRATAALTQAGHEATGHLCDVSDDDAVRALCEEVLERLGRIDILISNASALAVGPDRSGWDASLSVDLLGAVRLVECVLPGMREQGSGAILFTSSISAVEATPMPDFGYTAAKAALNSYAKKLAITEASNGIRVNALMPGSVEFPGGDWDRIRLRQPDL